MSRSNARVIDLSHTLKSGMKVYPGTPFPKIEKRTRIEKDGFEETEFCITSHIGTHIDAPLHMLKEGSSLADFPPDKFFGRAVAVSVSNNEHISYADIEPFLSVFKVTDYVIFNTGWYQHWESEIYFRNFPLFDTDVVKTLIQFPLKGIGIDMPSVDPIDSEDFKNHMLLFKADMIIIENLTNLNQLSKDTFTFACFPIKYLCADGAPVRAVAIYS